MSRVKGVFRRLREGALREMLRESRWIGRYARRYRRSIFVYVLLGLLATVVGLGAGVASKYLIDAVTGYDTGSIGLTAALYVTMGLLSIGATALSSRISAKIDIRVNNELRADVFSQLMDTEWESVSQYHAGDLLNRLNGDVSAVAGGLLSFLPNLITRSVQFIGALAVILYYDPTMAAIALVSAPIGILTSRLLIRRMRAYSRKTREASSELMAFQEEAFGNVQPIKAFGLTGLFNQKMHDTQQRFAQVQLQLNRFSVATNALLSLMGQLVSYACFGWGVYRLWMGSITFGTMMLFLQLSAVLSGAFSALVSLVPGAISATTSAGRILSILDLPREEAPEPQRLNDLQKAAERGGLTVQMTGVSFAYQSGGSVLERVSLSAAPGEIVALVGPSGEGKTTLLRLLLGLVRPSQGEAFVVGDGGQLKTPLSAGTRTLFAYVPQGNTLFSGTIAENLRMVCPEATDDELQRVLEAVCAWDFVKALGQGMNTPIGERGAGLSEGQSQRIAIARALLCCAPILLLDEATSALDIATERAVLRGVMELGQTRTCIVTTHRPSVLSVCARVYRVDKMRVTPVSSEAVERMLKDF